MKKILHNISYNIWKDLIKILYKKMVLKLSHLASDGRILLIKLHGHKFYDIRDLTIICREFYVVIKEILL